MEFKISVDIEAPPARVWAVMSDVERWPEWTESVRSVKRLDKGPFIVGSRARVFQPRLAPAVFEVTELAEGRYFTWVTRSFGVSATAKHSVESMNKGTRATLSIDFQGALSRLMVPLMRKLIEHYLDLEAAGLKRRSEEAAAPTGR